MSLAVARDNCFCFLSLEYLTDIRYMLSVGFCVPQVLALRLVWRIPLVDFMARNNFRLRGDVGCRECTDSPVGCLREWMWNSAVDCFLRTHWSTIAIVGGYPLYRMHHESALAVNAVAGVDVYTSLWEPAKLGELKASLERILGRGLVELDEHDFGARELGFFASPTYVATDGEASPGTHRRIGASMKDRLDALRFPWAVDPPLRSGEHWNARVVGWYSPQFDRVVIVHMHVHAVRPARAGVPVRSSYAATPVPGPGHGAWLSNGRDWDHQWRGANMLLLCAMAAADCTASSLSYWPGAVDGRASECAGPPITLLALDREVLALARAGQNRRIWRPLTRHCFELLTPRLKLYESRGFWLAPGHHCVAQRCYGGREAPKP